MAQWLPASPREEVAIRSMIVTITLVLASATLVLASAAQAEAIADAPFIFDWTVIASGSTFTGSSSATLTPSTISPTALDAFPGSRVYDLTFGARATGPRRRAVVGRGALQRSGRG